MCIILVVSIFGLGIIRKFSKYSYESNTYLVLAYIKCIIMSWTLLHLRFRVGIIGITNSTFYFVCYGNSSHGTMEGHLF